MVRLPANNSLFFLFVDSIIECTQGEAVLLEVFFYSEIAGRLALCFGSATPVLGASGGISGLVAVLALTQQQARAGHGDGISNFIASHGCGGRDVLHGAH